MAGPHRRGGGGAPAGELFAPSPLWVPPCGPVPILLPGPGAGSLRPGAADVCLSTFLGGVAADAFLPAYVGPCFFLEADGSALPALAGQALARARHGLHAARGLPPRALQICNDKRPARRERGFDRPEDDVRALRPRGGASCCGIWGPPSLRRVRLCDPGVCRKESQAAPPAVTFLQGWARPRAVEPSRRHAGASGPGPPATWGGRRPLPDGARAMQSRRAQKSPATPPAYCRVLCRPRAARTSAGSARERLGRVIMASFAASRLQRRGRTSSFRQPRAT